LKTIAIIPARGGSKSIPKKNIKIFCGKPLLYYSINTALKSSLINRVIVSSDDKEIIDIALSYGAEAPFIRPENISRDDTTDLPVFKHCLDYLKNIEGYEPEIVVHLRPTSPLRTLEMIDKGINLLINNPNADSVRTVCEPSQNPYKMWKITNNGFISPLIDTGLNEPYNQPRQNLPKVYWQNGYIDIVRLNTIINKKSMTGESIIPLVVDEKHIIDIDSNITFKLAEMLFNGEDSEQ
tara:strand:- start:3102 stop:3815 length:714 start_codon:yes stop_codon:yes gene_type:complete